MTFSDLTALMRASLFSFVVIGAIDYFFAAGSAYHIPRGVLILDTLLSILVLGSLRASWRLAREQFRAVIDSPDVHSALVVGTSDTTAMLAHQIQSHPESQYRIRGFLETNGHIVPRPPLGPDPHRRPRPRCGARSPPTLGIASHPDAGRQSAGQRTSAS